MIVGIGIDSVEIARFAHWHEHPESKLLRLFTLDEISYCLDNPVKQAERFAARFAAKEALFKAFCSMAPTNKLPLSAIAGAVEVKKEANGNVFLRVDWPFLLNDLIDNCSLQTHLSLTHTEKIATAFIILEKIEKTEKIVDKE